MKTIRIDKQLLAEIKRQDKASRHRIGAAIAGAQKAFGAPHQHSGTDIRKLKGSWYEARVGLGIRLVFQDRRDCLSFECLGNHETVRKFLKGGRP